MKKRPKATPKATKKSAATTAVAKKHAAAKKRSAAKKRPAETKHPAAKSLPAAKKRTVAKQGPIAKSSASAAVDSPSRLIDARIRDLGDWRGTTLAHVRALIRQAIPDVVEDWKWRGVPVWYHHGQLCTGETYKSIVKLTFLKGASLADPARLFNSGLDGNARRAIDIHEGDSIDAEAFKALIRAAAALNGARS